VVNERAYGLPARTELDERVRVIVCEAEQEEKVQGGKPKRKLGKGDGIAARPHKRRR
jgi:hypothetical protein